MSENIKNLSKTKWYNLFIGILHVRWPLFLSFSTLQPDDQAIAEGIHSQRFDTTQRHAFMLYDVNILTVRFVYILFWANDSRSIDSRRPCVGLNLFNFVFCFGLILKLSSMQRSLSHASFWITYSRLIYMAINIEKSERK